MTASPTVRLDKWLWAARFFKTRALAAAAIDGGKVHLNGTRAKRGKLVRVGDAIRIRKGPYEHHVAVREVGERRRSAKEAPSMYEETAESRRAREELIAQHRLASAAYQAPRGKPSKRDRRRITRFTGKKD